MYIRPWGLRHRGPVRRLTITMTDILPSTAPIISATRTTHLSLLNIPGHMRRYRHFTSTLTSDRARLAELCAWFLLHITGLPPAISLPVSLAYHILSHLRLITPLTVRTHPVEGLLQGTTPVHSLAPARKAVRLTCAMQLPNQAPHRFPQQANIRRPLHIRFGHRRINPAKKRFLWLLFYQSVTTSHHPASLICFRMSAVSRLTLSITVCS